MNAFAIARAVANAINVMDKPDGLTFTAEARTRTYAKAQDLKALTVHVIPLVPESEEVADRDGDILIVHNVLILVMDRMPVGSMSPNSTEGFAWAEARAALAQAITDMLTDDGLTVDGEELDVQDVNFADAVFDTPDADTLFGVAIQLTFT